MTETKTTVEKVGIVGCGMIAGSHVPAIVKALPEAQLLFCDADVQKAEAMAKRAGQAPVYADLEEMLSRDCPDSVHILTPGQTHYALARACLEADCHVLVEKPAVESTEELDHLFELAGQRGKIFSVDHTLLAMPIVMRAREKIATGALGELIALHCDFGAARHARMAYDAGHWAYGLRGGIVANNASHPASLLIDFMGPITDVAVHGVTRNLLPNEWPDVIHVSLTSDDQIGSFTLSQGHGNADRRAHLLFERGYISLDLARQLYSCLEGAWPHGFVKKAMSGVTEGFGSVWGTFDNAFKVMTKRLPRNPGLFNVVGSFYAAVDSRGELVVTENNVREVTRVLEAVWNKIESDNSRPRGTAAGRS